MAAPTNATLYAFTDSVAQACSDYNTNIAASSGVITGIATVNTGISGISATNTLGRILALIDPTSEQALLTPTASMVTNVAAYLTTVQGMNPFYMQLFSVLNAFDTYVSANIQTGGVNAWLTTNSLQVNAWYAAAHNYFVTLAIALGLRTTATAPIAISAANYFPYAIVDPMFSFVLGTGNTITSTTPGSATSTKGGGAATLYIYKSNATAPAGGATFTITYTNAAGSSVTVPFSDTTSSPGALGTVSVGSVTLGVAGLAVTAVSLSTPGVAPSTAENYGIGARLVRTSGY